MNLSKFRCLKCEQADWVTHSTLWRCRQCGAEYACIRGIPRLYIDAKVGKQDEALRDSLYNGFLGRYYRHVMPFLSLPVRPVRTYWRGWVTYLLVVGVLTCLTSYLAYSFFFARHPTVVHAAGLLILAGACSFLYQHSYLFFLLILAIPVRVSLLFTRFAPAETFQEIHAELVRQLLNRTGRLQVLDISTGTCNSLYRHGWMKLDADFTGLDLSETMLLQGLDFMAKQNVPMDFALGDAVHLPFQSETFDVVLNYGALNAYTDPRQALSEMARVAKKGALVLFLDEQLYPSASAVERLYFRTVLSGHNVIHRCPVEWIPESLGHVQVHQVYQFYYLCTCFKQC